MRARFKIEDLADKPGPPQIIEAITEEECGLSWLEIRPKGYGDFTSAEGHGCPIILEKIDGRLRLIVWADINNDHPTHTIDLEGAREI